MEKDSNTITETTLTAEFFIRNGFIEKLGTFILTIPNNIVNSRRELIGHVLPKRTIAYYQVNGVGASRAFFTEEEVIVLLDAVKEKATD